MVGGVVCCWCLCLFRLGVALVGASLMLMVWFDYCVVAISLRVVDLFGHFSLFMIFGLGVV